MPSIRHLSTALLLAGTSLAAPLLTGFANNVEARDSAAPCSPLPCAANGIEYVIATITMPYGSASTPTALSSPPSVTPVATPTNTNSQAPTPVSAATDAPKSALAPASSAAAPATSAAATPTPANNAAPSTASLTADTILKIMPDSGSCAGRDKVPGNCRTAEQAAAPLAKGFSTWGITVPGAQAANLALIAFESDQMIYKTSAQGIAGKGTYAVMMPDNVKLYATKLKGEAAVAQAGTPAAILDLVNANDDDAFGAASWYMAEQCPGAQDKFKGDVDAAWTSYITDCVNGGVLDQRQATWNNAKKAFGL
ncbi:hypothetical protein FKW77_009539 [Venturia effusa]|uniref:Uncharacterized protein n=1 Tax=Venturia effusa TaxID=50376 RepID=A0A517KXC2_9PEZI|nr:hypothetical protein FKW77_009539 [Venturia effusa]